MNVRKTFDTIKRYKNYDNEISFCLIMRKIINTLIKISQKH